MVFITYWVKDIFIGEIMGKLDGRRVAFLVADLTHDEEYAFPKYWLLDEGAEVVTVGIKEEHVSRFGRKLKPDKIIDEVSPDDFDAVVIPGGFGPDKLRANEAVLDFIREMDKKGKLIAAICHGPQVLISAGIVDGRRMTCVKPVITDLINAGADFVDEKVVVDRNIITSRHPYDLPAFTRAVIEALSSK